MNARRPEAVRPVAGVLVAALLSGTAGVAAAQDTAARTLGSAAAADAGKRSWRSRKRWFTDLAVTLTFCPCASRLAEAKPVIERITSTP